ncbi:hypothetical protein [Kingella oralis]|uniref:hypothetical protein n=1 Tax=Kingella oralis TaxID=505 RepID=UPI003C6F2933
MFTQFQAAYGFQAASLLDQRQPENPSRTAQPRFRLPKPAKLPILKIQPTKE